MTAATEARMQVTPLSGWTGALIGGVDLAAPLSADEIAGIRAALLQWKVVFFRDQRLDDRTQIAFGAQFGDVTPGQPYEGDSAPEGFPQIHPVSPAADDHRYGTNDRKKQSPNGPGWHADVTPLINPPSHSILRAERVPPYGGDTQFTNVAAVYQGLSSSVRFRWKPGSVAFWDNRAVLHPAPKDFEHLEGDRVLHRMTLVGVVPVGPDGRPSESVSGAFSGAA